MAKRIKKKPPSSKRIGLPKSKSKTTPYYAPEYCPKANPIENLEWRLRWRKAAATDRIIQRDFRQAAFDDVLFFFNAFGWCFEPRARQKIRPFCTWPHQDPAIVTMDQAITDSENLQKQIDVVVDKSRGQGATWIYLMLFLRRWLRDELFSAGLVTRNEKLVDSPRDPDTLMWKVIWALQMLPYWMIPEGLDLSKHRNLNEHSLINPANGATIVGYSATGDVARGGRKTVFAMDELAAFKQGEDYNALNSTQHVTNCRFLVSTYLGDIGAYYDAATQEGNAVKIIMDWKDNPTCNAKLYRVVKGQFFEFDPKRGNRLGPKEYEIIKEQHSKLKQRGYKIEDVPRNIWYNEQCLRPGATPRGIAQELDRNPHGSVAKIFDGMILKRMLDSQARIPVVQGRLIYNPETSTIQNPFIIESDEGELKLWFKPSMNWEVPPGSYVLGADISAGTSGAYTSNSVATIINRMTGEQVAEWTSNSTIPVRFASVCVVLARWFENALIIPEANFGGSFMKELVEEIGYENVYYREREIVGLHQKTQQPGFWMTNDDTKLKLFESMQEAMAEGSFRPRSRAMIDECKQYEWKNGKIIHVGSTKTDDEGSKGKAHGDRVIAASLAWMGCTEEPFTGEENEAETPVFEGTMAARLAETDRNRQEDGDPFEVETLDLFDNRQLSLANDPWG